MRLKIGIDARFATRSPIRGIGNYSRFLISELTSCAPDVLFYLYISDEDSENILPEEPNVIIKRIRVPFYPLWEQLSLPYFTWKDGIDILHSLGNTAPVFLPKSCKLVLSLMDVMFLKSADQTPSPTNLYQRLGKFYRKILVPVIARRARKIITISEFSKRDILDSIHDISGSVVEVIYLSCNPYFRDKTNSEFALKIEGKYILILGAEDPRKNTLRAVNAYVELVKQCEIAENLVIVGYSNWKKSASFKVIKKAQLLDRVVILDYISTQELVDLYRNASLFLFPSIYEGFGIPLIESFNVGCPVVASKSTSIPEVGGGAAIYVDPLSVEDIVEKIKFTINDSHLLEELIIKGFERANIFCWKKTALKTLDVYKLVSQEK
jgi:glycosyltransferase involved in cell wall biosynthesis